VTALAKPRHTPYRTTGPRSQGPGGDPLSSRLHISLIVARYHKLLIDSYLPCMVSRHAVSYMRMLYVGWFHAHRLDVPRDAGMRATTIGLATIALYASPRALECRSDRGQQASIATQR
jgi:hypothetical protein